MTHVAFITAPLAVLFAMIHIFVGQLRFLSKTPRSRWLSFSGGVAVAYVFLHLLPELSSHGAEFQDALNVSRVLATSTVYALALAGLTIFYAMERALQQSRGERRSEEGRDRPAHGVFWLHIALSSLLIVIIAYLLNHREDTSPAGLALYTVAMTLHFVTADFGTRSDHPELYDHAGRWVLVAATAVGWIAGTVIEVSEVAIGCLFAFLGGGIVLTILKEELPKESESRLLPFVGGVMLYGVLVFGELGAIG